MDGKLIRIGAAVEAEMESQDGVKEWLRGVVTVSTVCFHVKIQPKELKL
jgi:hypothetical protein